MKRTRYIILDERMGVFLGTYSGQDMGHPDDRKLYACFAANNPFGLTNACSFNNPKNAMEYIADTFAPSKRRGLNVASVESDSEYPDVLDLIRSGHAEHTYDMVDAMFDDIENPTIH